MNVLLQKVVEELSGQLRDAREALRLSSAAGRVTSPAPPPRALPATTPNTQVIYRIPFSWRRVLHSLVIA